MKKQIGHLVGQRFIALVPRSEHGAVSSAPASGAQHASEHRVGPVGHAVDIEVHQRAVPAALFGQHPDIEELYLGYNHELTALPSEP